MPLKTATVAIDTLAPYPDNPRDGDLSMIAESLAELGQYRQVVVNIGTRSERLAPMTILAGNHTCQAAADILGWTDIEVTYVDVDDNRAAKINAVDNRANDVAGYDDAALVAMLSALEGDLIGTGYTDQDLADLMAKVTPPSLDVLREQFGDAEAADVWPRFVAQVPEATLAKLNAALDLWHGPVEVKLLRMANHTLRTRRKPKTPKRTEKGSK